MYVYARFDQIPSMTQYIKKKIVYATKAIKNYKGGITLTELAPRSKILL